MAQPRPHVAIIGGGFSGAVTAVQLSRKAPGPLVIDIVEPRAMLGGGLAYSATDPAHRINVPASRMVVFNEDPCQFDRWMRLGGVLTADPAAVWTDGSAFPQRRVFGTYLATLVEDARRARPEVEIRHHRDTAIGIDAAPGGFAVRLGLGTTLAAGLVVLAVSHPPPCVPGALRGPLAEGAPIIADPWQPGALEAIDPGSEVLVVGTGLTMADVVASLARRRHAGRILAISRRGLLSRGHAFGDVARCYAFETASIPGTALGQSRAIRAQVRAAARLGQPWQAVFDDVRANAGRFWAALDDTERRRVVRHLRPYWDVHRFRISPQAETAIGRLREAGQFESVAACLIDALWDGAALAVRVRPRGAPAEGMLTIRPGAVVVTTGPGHAEALATNPALASLAEQRLVRADPAGLGLEVDARNRAMGADGSTCPNLLVVGPRARGRVGELMGLPQVSTHADAVAEAVADLLSQGTPSPSKGSGPHYARLMRGIPPSL